MSRKLIFLAAACALACLLPSAALASRHHLKRSYYLALGDSLARGAQPNAAGMTLPTNQGYANDLYAIEKKKIKGLKLEQLGCLGETTTTMMDGGICSYAAGSQLAQAVKFIRKHKIAFITLDIGANDVDGCATASGINYTCVANGVGTIKANVPTIVSELRTAAGKHTKIAGMTYYDPFLAEYLTGAPGQTEAGLSVQLSQEVNGTLATDFQAQNVRVADVATALDTYVPFTTTATFNGHTVPKAVAQVCDLTWMCASAPRGPNIHANVAGYQQIAATFKSSLR